MTNVRIVSRFGQKSLLNALTAVERARKWERERERERDRERKRDCTGKKDALIVIVLLMSVTFV